MDNNDSPSTIFKGLIEFKNSPSLELELSPSPPKEKILEIQSNNPPSSLEDSLLSPSFYLF